MVAEVAFRLLRLDTTERNELRLVLGDGNDRLCCFLANVVVEQTAKGAKPLSVSKGIDSEEGTRRRT